MDAAPPDPSFHGCCFCFLVLLKKKKKKSLILLNSSGKARVLPCCFVGDKPLQLAATRGPSSARLKTDSISGTGTAWGCPRCCCGRPRRAQGFRARSSLVLVLQLCLRACLGLALSDHIAGRVGKEPRRPTRSKHLQEAFHTSAFPRRNSLRREKQPHRSRLTRPSVGFLKQGVRTWAQPPSQHHKDL